VVAAAADLGPCNGTNAMGLTHTHTHILGDTHTKRCTAVGDTHISAVGDRGTDGQTDRADRGTYNRSYSTDISTDRRTVIEQRTEGMLLFYCTTNRSCFALIHPSRFRIPVPYTVYRINHTAISSQPAS
jgi:hypothetical protein